MNWPLVLCLLAFVAVASFVVGRLAAPEQRYVKRWSDGTVEIPEELFVDADPPRTLRGVREGAARANLLDPAWPRPTRPAPPMPYVRQARAEHRGANINPPPAGPRPPAPPPPATRRIHEGCYRCAVSGGHHCPKHNPKPPTTMKIESQPDIAVIDDAELYKLICDHVQAKTGRQASSLRFEELPYRNVGDHYPRYKCTTTLYPEIK